MGRTEGWRKPLLWVGSCRDDLKRFPEDVKYMMGYALYLAQIGGKHPHAMPMKGFGGAGVLEIVKGQAGDAYRIVYTVRFAEIVYVLHAFQKKSRRGIKTSKGDLDLIRGRLKKVEKEHGNRIKNETQAHSDRGDFGPPKLGERL